MAKKVVAIVGSYRKGGTVDTAVDAVLDGARERGAETNKIYLIDQHIEYCRNCRACTQAQGERARAVRDRGRYGSDSRRDESADAVVLGSPVNFYNVTAVFRTFLERLVGCVYWPWGQRAPKPRSKQLPRKAVLIASIGGAGLSVAARDGSPRGAALAANCLGARPVASSGSDWRRRARRRSSPNACLQRARRIGRVSSDLCNAPGSKQSARRSSGALLARTRYACYRLLMLERKSPLARVLLSLSMSNSMASTGESGLRTRRSTQMRCRSSLTCSSSSLRVPER